jgi:hypothetical protein
MFGWYLNSFGWYLNRRCGMVPHEKVGMVPCIGRHQARRTANRGVAIGRIGVPDCERTGAQFAEAFLKKPLWTLL